MSQASPDPSSPGFCPAHQGSGDLILVLLGRGRSCLDIFASGPPRWHSASSKEPTCQCRRHKRCGFDPWVGKIPWRRAWKPTLVFLPGESHGQRSLAGYSPYGCKESTIFSIDLYGVNFTVAYLMTQNALNIDFFSFLFS